MKIIISVNRKRYRYATFYSIRGHEKKNCFVQLSWSIDIMECQTLQASNLAILQL